jgi:hypothetical protein
MYYRYEAKIEPDEWIGVFQIFDPDQRRKWYCLREPKYYEKNPDIETKAWFTQHGYEKYHEKMDNMLSIYKNDPDIKIRIVTADTLDNIVMLGKTQCIQRV